MIRRHLKRRRAGSVFAAGRNANDDDLTVHTSELLD
jgi:hypothetical protein